MTSCHHYSIGVTSSALGVRLLVEVCIIASNAETSMVFCTRANSLRTLYHSNDGDV